jgi:alanyl-tRNA synthetase
VAGDAALELIGRRLSHLNELARSLGVPSEQVPERVGDLRSQLRELERRIEKLQDELRVAQVRGAVQADDDRVLTAVVQASDMDDLRAYADRFLESRSSPGVVAVTSGNMWVLKASKSLGLDLRKFKDFFGTGGGNRPDLVQGRLTVPPEEAFNKLRQALKQ